MMTIEKTEMLLDRLCHSFMNDLNGRDIQQLQKWFHAESTVCIPPAGPITGNGRIMAMFRAIFKKYSSIEWHVKEVYRLTHNRFIIFSDSQGILKAEIPYCNQLVTDISFNADGQINHLSDYFKNTAIFHAFS